MRSSAEYRAVFASCRQVI